MELMGPNCLQDKWALKSKWPVGHQTQLLFGSEGTAMATMGHAFHLSQQILTSSSIVVLVKIFKAYQIG